MNPNTNYVGLASFFLVLLNCLLPLVTQAAPPDVSGLLPFTAREPYEILVNGIQRSISLGGVPRTFQFAPVGSLFNTQTGQPDIATLLTGEPSILATQGGVLSGLLIPKYGVPGRVEISNGATVTTYRAGDGPVAGKARTQIASYPIPSRTRVLWELEVSLGSETSKTDWPMTLPGLHPVTIWQLKAPEANPSLLISVDSDPADPNKLIFVFAKRGGAASLTSRITQVGGVSRYTKQRFIIEAFLDEREIAAGGNGFWRVWLNNDLILDSVGPTLSNKTNDAHQWFLATYLYNDPFPVGNTWSATWSRARMFIPK